MPSPRSRTKSSPAPSKAGEPRATARARAFHGPVDALALFEADAPPATVYLEGASEPLKAAILLELRRRWAADNPAAPAARVLRAAEAGIEEILSAFRNTSLFATRELTIVLEIEDLGRSEKKLSALAAGLEGPSGESCLVLVESAADSARKSLEPLRRASAAHVVAMPPTRVELLEWGRRRLRLESLKAEPGVLEAIADACEGDALAFFSELARLTSFAAAGGTLTRSDCETLLTPSVGAGLPEYLAAVSAGEPRLASRRLGRLLAAGESEGAILFALTNLVGGALGGWARSRELSAELRSRLAPARLLRAMDALYRAESAWKGGRADVVAVLEQATRTVAAR
jgi:DNA polymerase III delta subunit